MGEKTDKEFEAIQMNAEDMYNICLIVLENVAAGLFMHEYHKEPLESYDCREMAVKIKGVVDNLRELISSGKIGGL
mgnify:FL=1